MLAITYRMKRKRINVAQRGEAGVTFDNSFFNNYFVRQLRNGSFLGPVFVRVTGRSKN
jgi:hypothetical protein